MDIRKAFEILEIGADTPPDKVKQAYKDLVAVWHPDRFSNNPRLRRKAEEKLKEANLAFETINLFFQGDKKEGAKRTNAHDEATEPSSGTAPGVTKTELAAELGTTAVLTLWSFLSKKVDRMLSDNPKKKKE